LQSTSDTSNAALAAPLADTQLSEPQALCNPISVNGWYIDIARLGSQLKAQWRLDLNYDVFSDNSSRAHHHDVVASHVGDLLVAHDAQVCAKEDDEGRPLVDVKPVLKGLWGEGG
jgi:uncharacterized protein (DUF1800 family)